MDSFSALWRSNVHQGQTVLDHHTNFQVPIFIWCHYCYDGCKTSPVPLQKYFLYLCRLTQFHKNLQKELLLNFTLENFAVQWEAIKISLHYNLTLVPKGDNNHLKELFFCSWGRKKGCNVSNVMPKSGVDSSPSYPWR